jgi:hypothetical protein
MHHAALQQSMMTPFAQIDIALQQIDWTSICANENAE